jgi:hypothetical protein
MPGEAQKIDRFVEVFVKTFWQDNCGTSNCPFRHQDTVHLVSYATIMLNTDLHRANSDAKKKRKKMTKEEFLNNLRGVDQGNNIDKEYLGRIYDNIEVQPIEMAVQSASDIDAAQANLDEKSTSNDLAISRLASNANKILTNDLRIAEEKKFIREVCRSMRDSEDLLRSLSSFTFRFQSTGVDTMISLDLVTYMYETVWFHFHAIVESLLFSQNSDTYVIFAALDILCYSLTSAIFVGLKIERMAFATLLIKFQKDCEDSMLKTVNNEKRLKDKSWFEDVENANPDTSMETIAKVHTLMVHIKDTIQETTNYELTQQIAAKFEKKVKVLDTNTFFVRQVKRKKIIFTQINQLLCHLLGRSRQNESGWKTSDLSFFSVFR